MFFHWDFKRYSKKQDSPAQENFFYSLKILSQTLKVFTLVIFSKFKVIAKIYRSVNSKTAKTDFMIDHVDTHQMVTGTTIIPARNLSLVLSGSEPSENELSLYVDYKGWLVSKSFKSLEHLFPACLITMKNCIFVC